MSKIIVAFISHKFFLLFWQSLAELREEESLLLKERRNLKNVRPLFPWLLVTLPFFLILNICLSYGRYLDSY
jgi:hypothetical protein